MGVGCTKSHDALVCTDISGLTPEDKAARELAGYAERTLEADKTCERCQQWVEPKDSASCGACKLMKGPIHPLGGCKVFAKRA